MGKCFLHGNGGGAALTYKVVGGTAEPANPKENMIWINTDKAITSHVFSATEPGKPANGMVWFKVGSSSPVGFSATRRNPVMVYPVSAKQYDNSAWVSVTAKSYVNEAWKDWMVYLFQSGEGNAADFETAVYSENYGTAEITDEHIRFSQSYGECLLGFQKKEKVDLTYVNTIYFEVDCTANHHQFYLGVSKSSLLEMLAIDATLAASALPTSDGKQTCSLDVSGLSGEYYIGGRTNSGQYADNYGKTDVLVTNIWYV